MHEVAEQHQKLSRREQLISLGSFLALVAIVSFFLLRGPTNSTRRYDDEAIGHFGAAAALTVAGTGSVLAIIKRFITVRQAFLIGVLATVTLELAQGFIPTRSLETQDMAIGLGGVLVAGIAIDLLWTHTNFRLTLRALTASAGLACLGLLGLVVVEATGTLNDTVECTDAQIAENGRTRFTRDPSQPPAQCRDLGTLTRQLAASETFTLRTEFTTTEFGTRAFHYGTLALLESDEYGGVLHLRTRQNQIALLVNTDTVPHPAVLIYSAGLEPATTYELVVSISDGMLTLAVDDMVVGTVEIDASWRDRLGAGDLYLFIANNNGRLPFEGTINWVEIDTNRPGP